MEQILLVLFVLLVLIAFAYYGVRRCFNAMINVANVISPRPFKEGKVRTIAFAVVFMFLCILIAWLPLGIGFVLSNIFCLWALSIVEGEVDVEETDFVKSAGLAVLGILFISLFLTVVTKGKGYLWFALFGALPGALAIFPKELAEKFVKFKKTP